MANLEKPETPKIPEYDLKNGLEKLTALIEEKETGRKEPLIVAVAGGSASGKTSAVAEKIRDDFGNDAILISMDDYYRGKKFMDEESLKGNALNWDEPRAINMELFREHLRQLKSGQSIEKPVYDFKSGEPAGTEEIEPKKIIIAEGLFTLEDSLGREADIKVFVDIGFHGKIIRRLLRDISRTGQKPAEIIKYFSEVVEPMHEKHIASTKNNADLIIRNEYLPEKEAVRSPLTEIQIKFKTLLDEKTLEKLGAKKLGEFVQQDRYYSPRDKDLSLTDEMLRVREENGRRILTYKGPKIASHFRQRPKLEFEIDKETEEKFLAAYGPKIKTIQKAMNLYDFGGVKISFDTVIKIEQGKPENLGLFLEIRSLASESGEEKIKSALARLNLRTQDGIKESYFEM